MGSPPITLFLLLILIRSIIATALLFMIGIIDSGTLTEFFSMCLSIFTLSRKKFLWVCLAHLLCLAANLFPKLRVMLTGLFTYLYCMFSIISTVGLEAFFSIDRI